MNRVTILTDKFGGAKGYAYIEFEKADAAVSALLLADTTLRSREIKVCTAKSHQCSLQTSLYLPHKYDHMCTMPCDLDLHLLCFPTHNLYSR